MISTFITTGITAFFTVLLLAYLTKGYSAKIHINGAGQKTLRVHKFLFYLGLICMTFGVLFSLSPLYLNEDDTMVTVMIMVVMTVFFGLTGAFLLLDYKNSVVCYDDKSILVRDFRKRDHTIHWKNLKGVSYSSIKGQVILHDGMKKVGFNQYMKGTTTLLDDIQKHSKIDTQDVRNKLNAFKSK